MDYKKIKTDNYTIHLINNKKFHTIEFRIFFTENVSEELITYRNALVNILTYATSKYDTKKKLIKECQDLYSLYPSSISLRNGNLLSTRFGISTIKSKYINEDNLKENILLLKEIILNPLVKDGAFLEKYFNIVKKELETESNTIIEDPRLYASLELLKILNDGGVIYSGYTDLNILNKMTAHTLYESYLLMLKNSKIDIFVSGDISNPNKIIDIIKNNFIFKDNKPLIKDGLVIHERNKKQVNYKEETRNFSQSKLVMGYKLYDLTDDENRYVSFVFNNLLGSGVNSLLMRDIREEKSLCYYINSHINRLDNIMMISSGINKGNYEEVVKLTKEIINKVIDGNFSDGDLADSKMEILFSLSSVLESNRSIIEYYYGMEMFHSAVIEERMKKIENIKKEDIMEFAKKIEMKAIFFLKGDL